MDLFSIFKEDHNTCSFKFILYPTLFQLLSAGLYAELQISAKATAEWNL